MPVYDEFEISFADRPFRRPTSAVLEFCERYFSDGGPFLVQWPDPAMFAGGMQQYQLPLPPAPPKFRLNRWFYPFGLSRWSVYWGLMTGDDVAALITTVFGSGGPNYYTFRIKCTGNTHETPMTMLPPFKLAYAADDNQALYLVTLVDERYFERTRRFISTQPSLTQPSEADTETVPSPYSGLTLAGPAGTKAAGIQNHSTLTEFALYDHAAACMGMVYCRRFAAVGGKQYYRTRWRTANALAVTEAVGSETVNYVANAGSSAVTFDVASASAAKRAVLPATVRVGFPAVTGTITPSGTTDDGRVSWYWKTVSPPGGIPVGPKLAAITTMQPATYAATPTSAATPTNSATLGTLADQIGLDFYDALIGSCDLVYEGLAYLNPLWACDFTFDGSNCPGERSFTRIARDPFNGRYAVDLLMGKDLKSNVGGDGAGGGVAVKITGALVSGPLDYYPATADTSPDGTAWATGEVCRVVNTGTADLKTGKRYPAIYLGVTSGGVKVYAAKGAKTQVVVDASISCNAGTITLAKTTKFLDIDEW